MENSLQKAGLWKRVAAGIFDMMLIAVLAVGFGALLSWALNYNSYSDAVTDAYAKYETQYGVTFHISLEDYEALTEAEKANYDAAYQALISDEAAIEAYNMTVSLSMVIVTFGVLIGVLLMELLVPILLGHGRTLGKKVFGLCVVRTDGVKLNGLQLVTRSLLGKFTIGIMIPVITALMLFWGTANLFVMILVMVVLAAQIVSFMATRTNSLLHDLLAGTAVVDYNSQAIFRSTEDLIAYQKQIAAERAARQDY